MALTKKESDAAIANWLNKLSPKHRKNVKKFTEVVLAAHPQMQMVWMLQTLFFRLRSNVFYVNVGKPQGEKEPQLYVGFIQGALLEDVSGLLQGKGTHKIIRWVSLEDISVVETEEFLMLLQAVIDYNTKYHVGKKKPAGK